VQINKDDFETISIRDLNYIFSEGGAQHEAMKGFDKEFQFLEDKFPMSLTISKLVDRHWPDLAKIVESVEKDGLRNPLCVYLEPSNKKYYVIAGNQRLFALKVLKLGIVVACHVIPDYLDKKHLRDYVIDKEMVPGIDD
jgi:hypothetical protein